MYSKTVVVPLYLLAHYLTVVKCNFVKYDAESSQRVQQWMKTEEEFHKLDDELRNALSDHWEAFKQYVTEKIHEHHSMDNDCLMTNPIEACEGKGSLTESEFILHHGLDVFGSKIGGEKSLNHYHKLVHTVFEATRHLLRNLSLIQNSEYTQPTIIKQMEMRLRYS